MTKTVEAIYENGVLKLPAPLPLPEKTHVTVTIQTTDDSERSAWLKVCEDKLAQTWGDSDDVFNELLENEPWLVLQTRPAFSSNACVPWANPALPPA